MAHFTIVLLTTLISVLPPAAQNIEKAFLQNNTKILYSLFPVQSAINISLPEPISFSDQVSNQQAYFLFRKIFSSFTTLEFYSEPEPFFLPENQSFIFKARWSFSDNKNNQYPLHLFFYLVHEKHNDSWKIIEIKAEKI